MDRLNKIILVVGRRGSGKTTFAKKLASSQNKKILVVDTFDHPSYVDYKLLTTDKLAYWQKGAYRVFDKDPLTMLLTINTVVRNAFLILEDAAKYLSGNTPKEIKNILIDSRNRNLDIILMFHNLSDIPPYIAKMCNDIVLFRTNDNMDKTQAKFFNFHELQKLHTEIKANKSPHYYKIISIQ